MDSESGQTSSFKAIPVKTNIRLSSLREREGSPSPYDFCNDSRSDEDDDEGLRWPRFHSPRDRRDLEEDAAGDTRCKHLDTVRADVTKASSEKNQLGSRCQDPGSESSGGYIEETEEGADEDSFYASIYKQPLVQKEKDLPLDIENNTRLWVAPPPEDDDEQFDSSSEDDDTDSGSWSLTNSLGILSSSKFRSKENLAFEHRKALVTGHFRVVVGQLLSREGVPADENGPESWLEIVTSLSLQAAGIVKPDTSLDGGMDPCAYVKVMCVATGRPAESRVVRGIVCKKNIAHRRMTSRFKAPRLLLLGGSLEFQIHLFSLQTLMQQEPDHIAMAISRIEAHHPNLLLVEKTVSRQAQEGLLAKGISLVLNVKRSLLERIARCTGATIASNLEHLASAKVGHCEQFHVEKYNEEHDGAAQGGKALTKTLMFFEDCPKPFGCSILLKGGTSGELRKVKRAVKLAVFAAYHLTLETSFLADEGANIPELCLKSSLSMALPDRKSKSELSISTVSGYCSSSQRDLSPKLLMSQSDTSSLLSSKAISPSDLNADGSRSVTGTKSSGLQEVIGATLGKLSEGKTRENLGQNVLGFAASVRETMPEKATDFSPAAKLSGDSDNVTDSHLFLSSIGEMQPRTAPEEEKGAKMVLGGDISSQASKTGEDSQDPSQEDFPPSPSNHQSILVSFSSSCLKKRTVCERGHLIRIKYYGTFDRPLKKFLQETLFDQTHKCPTCGELKDAHVDCYTHRQGSLTISVHKQDESLAGPNEDKIWMWHRCLKCTRVDGIPPANRRIVMSDAACGLSFGKYLELSFSNHAAANRAASCGHSLHRDCLRFYGFGHMVACIRYSPVHIYSVYLPPSKLDFRSEHQDWLQQEIREIADKGGHLFKTVLHRLQLVHDKLTMVDEMAQEVKTHILELKDIRAMQKDSFQKALNDAASCRGADQPQADILRLNLIRRSLSKLSSLWDNHIQHLSSPLKSPRSFKGLDVGLSGDSPLSFLKEFSFGSRNRSPYTSREPSVAESPKADLQATAHFPSEKSKSTDGLFSLSNVDASAGGLDSVAVMSCTLVSQEPSSGYHASKANEATGMGEKLHSRNSLTEGSSQQGSVMSNACVSGGAAGVQRSLSEGHVFAFKDVSATFDAAWTGESQSSSEFDLALSSVEKGKVNAELEASSAEGSRQSSSDTSEEGSSEISGQDLSHSSEFCLDSTLTSPAKSGEPSDIESWVGTPYLSFPTSYNKNLGTPLSRPKAEAELPTLPTVAANEQEHPQEAMTVSLFSDADEPVVSVYDDEPTTVIAYALTSHEHQDHLLGKSDKQREKDKDHKDRDLEIISVLSGGVLHLLDRRLEHALTRQVNTSSSLESLPDDPLLDSRASHVKVNFTNETTQGRIKYAVTCYYAKQFDCLRKRCCKNDLDFIRSLCRCKRWGAQGGKSNVFFAKTADDRFVVKQVTKTELESFITFAPAYFKHMSDALGTGSPTCLAKILGIYQVTVKHVRGGKELRMDLMIMENLLYGRHVTRVYDLKGSSRSRYIDATAKDAVLLDQNLLESLQTNPIFISNKAKRLLERAVWNDTAFLASVDVMDYSLLVGVDEGRRELVLGIIDFMRQYTWDKHLETWVKASGILGGPKNVTPTVISPKQYKKRFRKAMSTYFLMVPDQWSPPTVISDVDDSNSAASADYQLNHL